MHKTISSLILLSTLSCFSFASAQTQTRARVVVPETADAAAKDVDNTSDPVLALRDQIDAAADAPERNRLHLKLADLLLSTGHRQEAMAELKLIADSNSFDPTGFYNAGNSYARLGESEAAIAAYRTAIEQRKGRYSRAYNNLGVVLLRAGRWDEAHDALLSALKLENFRYAEASYNLGRVYSARGQNDLAAREWRRAVAVDPAHDAATQALARVGTEGRITVASQPPKAVRNAPAVAAKPATAKVAVPKSSEAPVSAATPAKSLELDQTSFDYLQRARNASERGKMPEAVDNFRRVIKLQNGYFPPANLELSYALLSLKRYDEALTNLLEVSQRDGARYPVSYFHLGRLYELKGELKLAEAAFSQAATAYGPTNGQFLLDLSRVREKQGDFKGSLEAMERYLKLMQEQGQKPTWSDERLAELRTKAAKQP
jgi:tetratricopeptide (TPR) repeat protein